MSELVWNEIAGWIVIIIGVGFDTFGCIGLVRMPDIYNRLQAGTKCVTLGTCMILLGVFIMMPTPATAVKALICGAFVLITAPTGAHALARGSHRSGVKLWEGSIMDKYAEDKEGEKIEA